MLVLYCFLNLRVFHKAFKLKSELELFKALQKYGKLIPFPLTERQIFRKLGFEKGGQIVKPRSERW